MAAITPLCRNADEAEADDKKFFPITRRIASHLIIQVGSSI
jgi:hypothetical protein